MKMGIAFVVAIFVFTPLFAQTYMGRVAGKDKRPLAGASVVAADGGNKTISYCITDDFGVFRLEVPGGQLPAKVTVNFLGFLKKTIPFPKLKNGITITLEEGSFKLKEVTVSLQRIKGSGDTITYNVAAFRQKHDRSIADVIAKMPGLEVKADGKIEYQGKAINKFYIEGLDLMGAQYGVANKNVSADKIKSVQVLENHQMVKSLRGVKFSDHAALNIVLRDDAKAVWSRSADIGMGYGNDLLYDCRLMGMRFNKKFQTLMMYKNNNTGNDIGSEVNELAVMQQGEKTGSENGILKMMSVGTPTLDADRYTFNHSHLAAGNWLWKTGSESELRIQGNAYIDKENMGSYRQTTYLAADGQPVVVEEQIVDNTRSEWKAEAHYQYNGARTFVKNNIRGYVDFNKSTGTMLYNNDSTNMMVKPQKRYLIDDFQLSHTTAEGNVYGVNSHITYSYIPGQLLTINNCAEHITLNFFSMDHSLEYKLKLGRQYLDNTVGMSCDNQQTCVSVNGEKGQFSRYRLTSFFWKPSTSFIFGNHRLNIAIKLSHVAQTYRQVSSEHFWVEPSLYWNWKSSAVSEFSVKVSFRNSPLMGKAICDIPMFTDYRTQQTNRGRTGVTHVTTVTAAYKYSNPVLGLFFNICPVFTCSSGNILYTNCMNGNVYTMAATDNDYTMNTAGMSGRVSKSLGWARTNIGVNLWHSITGYSLLIADKINDARIRTTKSGIDYSLSPLRQLSVEGVSCVAVTRQQNLTQHGLSPGSITSWQHSLTIHVYPTDRWMISLKNELFHSSERSFGTNFFCDLVMSYKTRHWELSLTASNILGTSELEQRMLGNTVETYSKTRLRPREVSAVWSVDI